ncbi:MAG: SusC/RagA family TonB-linked outer membrane protein [Chitinophagales bacterium]|nr:SusC/RagA family TonB-linked outer membrane protein [Chitinophagales bacterium]
MRKMLRLFLAFSLMLLLLPQAMQAQERTITGTIVSEDNKTPLAGVTVRVKGTRKITQTDANGKFTLKVNTGEILVATYVGYTTVEVKPGAGSTVGITLKTADNTMGEVVVTAMDIKRTPRELGYSLQKVDGKDIQETQRENFVNALQGRVSGLTVSASSGLAGSSSTIVLRGFNSLAMSNQPLFVIDGVIIDNQTIDENSQGGAGVGMVERTGLASTSNRNTDYSNRISDINPNDIETITVLKGPEATALYGSQASSGAIIITTKKGKSGKASVQYDNSFRFSSLKRFPEVLNKYSGGTNGIASGTFRAFGPEYASGTAIYDNIDAFFKTGFSQTHNLGVDFSIKNSTFRVSGSYFDQDGTVPNNWYKRYTGRITNTTKFGKFMDVSPTFSYTNTVNNKVLGSLGGFMLSLLAWPSTDDIRIFSDPNGEKLSLFNTDPNQDFDSPLFNVNFNKNREKTERYTANLSLNIYPFKWLTLSGRFGYETYNTEGYLQYHPDSYFITAATKGLQDNFWRKYFAYNHTLTATARKSLGKFNFRAMGGTMWQDYETQMFAVSGNTLTDPNRTDSNNTLATSRTRLLRNNFGEYNISQFRQFATFGEFAVNYKSIAFFNYTHRFESVSTLSPKNRNYNYPGASLSFIVSDIFPNIKKGNLLNYLKIRTSLASTARINSPYSTQSVFVNTFTSGGGFNYGFTRANELLKPEKQQTYEVGTEWRFFKSRLNLELTYYNTLNKDQIVDGDFRLSYATGYVINSLNVASTRNQGVEVVLNSTIIKTDKAGWDMAINFNRMWNKVIYLPDNVPEYYIAATNVFQNIRAGVVRGFPTTTITGFGYARNQKGDILIDPLTGLPLNDGAFKIRGDRNPDFTIGWNNNLRIKNWRLSMLWDLKVGGDIFNGTQMFMTNYGKSILTADRYNPRVIKGVLRDGQENTATPTVNKIVVIPAYNDAYYGYTAMPEEAYIEKDINWFRLRDITISYTFPSNLTKSIRGLKSLSVFATGNEVILMTNYTGGDPAANANTAGQRGVGSFGFDYGKVPTPINFNFGIKASL